MKKSIAFDPKSYIVDGKPDFLVSGEFHYFRVPAPDWRKRLELLLEAGCNCVSTYIPWILHEPEEGDIRFGDIPERDLEGFLKLCEELGLFVICRPGPYQYSEMKYDGLPVWLCENNPQILARNANGEVFRMSSVSYMHPVFLEKAKVWYGKVCPLISKYTLSKGGPVAFIQIDNEMAGVHEWYSGGWDYNREGMGIGMPNGRYPRFLEVRYGSITKLNAAYGTSFKDYREVEPISCETPENIMDMRRIKDYQDFYFSTLADYSELLKGWIRDSGIDVPVIHNAAGPDYNACFHETASRLGKDFLLGSDHYYNLGMVWEQNNPTPQYAAKVFCSSEMLRHMGFPATVLELPAGSLSDWPPITPEELCCCYMTNAAFGMKGLNYYIFTGGPNPGVKLDHGTGSDNPGTRLDSGIGPDNPDARLDSGIGPDSGNIGLNGDLYDYGAPVSSAGELRPIYHTLSKFSHFLRNNTWLAAAEKVADINIGLDYEYSRSEKYFKNHGDFGISNLEAWDFMVKGLLMTSLSASFSPSMVDLYCSGFTQDTPKPLLVAASVCMARTVQQNIISFVQNGGKLLLAPVIPHLDESFNSCTLLKEFLEGAESETSVQPFPTLNVGSLHNVPVNGSLWVSSERPADAVPIAFEERSGQKAGWKKDFPGGGRVIWLGLKWIFTKNEHMSMLKYLLNELGVSNTAVQCDTPNIWTSLRRNDKRGMLYIMNLFSSPFKASVKVKKDDGTLMDTGTHELAPMEVKAIEVGF